MQRRSHHSIAIHLPMLALLLGMMLIMLAGCSNQTTNVRSTPVAQATSTPIPTSIPQANEPMHTLAIGSTVSVAELTSTPDIAYRTWMVALTTFDLATADLLYRPVTSTNREEEMNSYMDTLKSVISGRANPELGNFDDLIELGHYVDDDDPKLYHVTTKILLDNGEVCLEGTTAEDTDGWHVRSWGVISEKECQVAIEKIALQQ